MHTVVVRKSLLEAYPWFVGNLRNSFEEARAPALMPLLEVVVNTKPDVGNQLHQRGASHVWGRLRLQHVGDVFADSAYRSAESEVGLKARGFRSRIPVRATRSWPVSSSTPRGAHSHSCPCSASSRVRFKVERMALK